MKNMALTTAGIIFITVSALHLLRLLFEIPITVYDFAIPVWASAIACVVTASLSIWMFKAR